MIKKSRELKLPAFFVRPGTLFIVYCIQIFTLSVPVCALKHFLSSTIFLSIPCALRHFFSFTLFKSLLHTFQRVPWGTYSRLLYTNLWSIRSSVCFKALSIVYCIKIYTLSVPPCVQGHFLSSIAFKLFYLFYVPWGAYSRLLYSNIKFYSPLFDSLFVKNSLFIEYYFQKLSLSVPLWVLRQLLSIIIFKIQTLSTTIMRWHTIFLY